MRCKIASWPLPRQKKINFVPKPTPIFINARFLTEPLTGIQRWGRETLTALDQLIEDGVIDGDKYSFTLLSPVAPENMPSYRHLPLKIKGLLRSHFWEQFELPFIARGLLLNFKTTAPMFKHNKSMLIHDLQPFARPGTHSFIFNALYKLIVPIAARNAKVVTCLSNNTAAEVAKYLKIDTEDCIITGCGHEHILSIVPDDSVLSDNNLESNTYLLAVSSLNPNKNFSAILRAIKLSGVKNKLVIAGGANPKIFRGSGIAELPPNVIYVGRVSDEQLRSLYENALGFVYPSFYEGWGLPPGEAMLLNCPVIASNTTSLTQVCGDAVLYCDPADDNSIAEQIRRLCEDDALRAQLIEDGFKQSQKFTWRQVALNVWRSIEKARRE